MLQFIDVINFVIFDSLHQECHDALTIITGESGAGKSVIIDALRIILGASFNTEHIQHGKQNAEISACFDIAKAPAALNWLSDNDFHDEGEQSCIIRRTIHREGRSQNYINGRRVSVKQLKELGSILIHIHGQHANHDLVKPDAQRELLDRYLQSPEIQEQVKSLYDSWKQLKKQIDTLQKNKKNPETQTEWLQFQLDDLRQLNLAENELEELHAGQRALANAERILHHCQSALDILHGDTSPVIKQLYVARQKLAELLTVYPILASTIALLDSADINLQEASHELDGHLSKIELNQEQLDKTEKRLSQIHDTARKYRIKPENLAAFEKHLENELATLSHSDVLLEKLEKESQEIFEQYLTHAHQLSKLRQKAANTLAKAVTTLMQSLGMQGGIFAIHCKPCESTFQNHGIDTIEFQVTTNPGVPLRPLSQVASGGEISRLSLAIQVATQNVAIIPTLIFDEVDIGISGSTAESLGKLLKQLSTNTQILTITHLAQVAVQAQRHLKITKHASQNQTTATMHYLTQEERITEIARLVSGTRITEQTLAHAKELLGELV